jgi:hypothetical protein
MKTALLAFNELMLQRTRARARIHACDLTNLLEFEFEFEFARI